MKTVIANWKANPITLEDAKSLFQHEANSAATFSDVKTIICPPFVFLEELSSMHMSVNLGAQDVSSESSGPHTGEVPVAMLQAFGISHVLVGHSDRRRLYDTDEIVNKKVKLLLEAKIIPVVFFGESEKNDAIRNDVLVDQITRGLDGLSAQDLTKILPVYEPVWSISTNEQVEVATPQDAVDAMDVVQSVLGKMFGLSGSDMPEVLYGGSVNPQNVLGFFARKEIAGSVVGGASLKPDEFHTILNIAHENA